MITSVTIGSTLEPTTTEYNTLTSIQDEMDIGTLLIPFSTRNTRYEPFTLVDVLMKDNTHEYWWLDSDITEVVDKQDMIHYEHKIQLIELTKILERHPMPDRAFVQLSTGTQLTALDVVNSIIATVPFRDITDVSSGAVIDSIDSTLEAKLLAVEVPDLYLTGRTMKEAFVEIFKLQGIDGYPRLTRDINGNFILDADFYNELIALVDKDSDNYFNQEIQNSSKYASSLNLTATNMIYSFNKNTSFVVEPSLTGWLSVRSDSGMLNTDDAFVETNEEIDESVKWEANISYISAESPGGQTDTFDISDHVLEEEVRNNLDPLAITNEPAQDNTISYKLGQPNVNNLYEVFEEGLIINIKPAIERLYAAVVTKATGDTFVAIPNVVLEPDAIEIRAHYTAKINAIQEIDRIDLTDTSTTSTLIIGQGDSFIASDRLLDATLSKANRLGSRDINTKSFGITDIADIFAVGSFTSNGFILTGVERVAYPEHFEVLYQWTKDYQKVSDFIGLNSEPKLYEVQSTLVRNELYKEYIIADTNNVTNDSFFETFGINVFANTFQKNPSVTFDKPIHAISYQSTSIPNQIIAGEAIVKPIVSYAGGNTMAFWFGFKNFKNAGKQLVREDDTFFNVNVEYTDSDGRADDFQAKYVHDYVSDPNLLPVIDEPLTNFHIDTGIFRYNKNQAEIGAFTLQEMLLPSQARSQDIIIGDYLTKNNNLINFKDGNFDNLVIYSGTERYSLSDNRFAKGTNRGGALLNTDINVPFIEITTPLGSQQDPLNWALGDNDGNLYLAVNQMKYNLHFDDDLQLWVGDFENINRITFNFVKERY